jgi:two-component system response regulator GlrR
VRELRNVIERAALMSGSPTIRACDLSLVDELQTELPEADLAAENNSESFRNAKARVVRAFERDYIERLLAANDGNVSRAARAAKKNRRAFFELMRKHCIQPDQFRADSRVVA